MPSQNLPTRQEQQAAGTVWCDRCGKTHNRITFTQEDYDEVVRRGAQAVAVSIDRQAYEHWCPVTHMRKLRR